MRALIITNYSFPFGMAQTNRLIAMSKGLLYAGAIVEVIISKATELNSERNKEPKGNYQGVNYEYATKTCLRPKSKFKRVVLYYQGLFRLFGLIIRKNKETKVDALFLGVHSNAISLLLYLLCRILKIKFIQERSEYPFLSYKKNIIGKLKLKVYLKIVCSCFDGFIVISKALQNYFRPYLKEKAHKFLLPILVEAERFKEIDNIPENTITYCGSMQGDKDGVPILIEAFSKISSKFPETKLKLIGSTNFSGFEELKKNVKSLKLENRVVFTGRIERENMPELLIKSRVLALARPASKQAEGGFPTKLGEYLATGRITVVTKVGDIPDYLKHEENALLATPGNVDDFAEKLSEALSENDLIVQVGKNGKLLAEEVFNYKVQGVKLYNWLKSFIEK